jgi:hypothetical protein
MEERTLKKNQGKKWIDIKQEGIILPAIEPSNKDMPIFASTIEVGNYGDACYFASYEEFARSRRKNLL